MTHEWKQVLWDSGWSGTGKKMPSGEKFTLTMMLEALEREGWEIFAVHAPWRSTDREILVRRKQS